jgi:hypothetical protein
MAIWENSIDLLIVHDFFTGFVSGGKSSPFQNHLDVLY